MKEDVVPLLTPGRIAAELGVPLPRVLYVLATRPLIRPRARAGILRLYDRCAVEMIRQALNAIDAHRCGLDLRRPASSDVSIVLKPANELASPIGKQSNEVVRVRRRLIEVTNRKGREVSPEILGKDLEVSNG